MRSSHWFLIGLLWIAASSSALAAARTWNGSAGDSNWFNAGNWDGGVTIPQDGDSVTITNNSQVWLTNATAWLDTFEITNATFTFRDTTNLTAVLRATNVYIRNLGIVTHATNSVTATNAAGGWDVDGRVYILCSNLVLDAGGQIKADDAGYAATNGGIGFGPGGGTNTATYGGGGSYGGKGYWYAVRGPTGQTYGSESAPAYPGSAGGSSSASVRGGSGGGLVIVHASGQITINGTISVNGQAGDVAHGSGSGGGVYLTCNTFGGSGLIRAIGGQGTLIDPGGGGRIAIVYTNSVAQAAVTPKPTVQFTAKCGHSDNYGWDAGNGTLYLPDSTFFPYEAMLGGFKLVMALTNWSPNALTISNGVIEFPDNCVLSVTNAVSLTNTGGILLQNGSALTCGVVRVASSGTATITNNTSLVTTGNMEIAGTLRMSPAVFHCGGHLIVTNAGKLYLFSGLTNGASPDYGLLAEVIGDVTVASNAYIYIYSHPTNGGSPLLTAANVRIAAGGWIKADGAGYAGTPSIGLGPGGGLPYDANGSGGGGSYGGRGGCLIHTVPTYGSSNAPVDPGSAGGGYQSDNIGGNGGGLVKIWATGNVWVDGTISSTGTVGGHVCGGGSGGGIYIICNRFGGAGAILAVGANGANSGTGPGGGGGRIAIWRMYDNTWSGALSYPSAVAGGTSSTAGWSGDPGTIFFGQVPLPGTIFTFR